MSEVQMAILAAVLSLVVSLTAAAMQAAAKRRSDQRKRESLLSLEMMMANNKLSYACAMAIKRGTPNGEIEDAIEAYDDAKEKYNAFLREMAAGALR